MLDFNFKVPKYVKRRQVILEIRMVQFGSVRCSVRPYFAAVRFGSAEPQKRQFGRSLHEMLVIFMNVSLQHCQSGKSC